MSRSSQVLYTYFSLSQTADLRSDQSRAETRNPSVHVGTLLSGAWRFVCLCLCYPRNELPGADEESEVRLPRAVQAIYLKPLRRTPEYGVPSCDLQLRSYSIPNLEFFCDFALRAAYFLGLPAFGPVPLPKITERWTVPRSHFIFKKSQENFERITRRRLIQIRDGHPETVQVWLAFLQKHAYYGIGMKANMWEYSPLGKCCHEGFSPGSTSAGRLTVSQIPVHRWTQSCRQCRRQLTRRWNSLGRARFWGQLKRSRSC